jgi:hypothetical protein
VGSARSAATCSRALRNPLAAGAPVGHNKLWCAGRPAERARADTSPPCPPPRTAAPRGHPARAPSERRARPVQARVCLPSCCPSWPRASAPCFWSPSSPRCSPHGGGRLTCTGRRPGSVSPSGWGWGAWAFGGTRCSRAGRRGTGWCTRRWCAPGGTPRCGPAALPSTAGGASPPARRRWPWPPPRPLPWPPACWRGRRGRGATRPWPRPPPPPTPAAPSSSPSPGGSAATPATCSWPSPLSPGPRSGSPSPGGWRRPR